MLYIDAVTQRLRRGWKRLNRLFLFTVALPTTLAALYYGLVASDIYVSESRFVIRSPQKQAPSGLGAVLQGVGFARSQDDTYSVHDFMTSRDALALLDADLPLRAVFSSNRVDVFSRFNGWGLDDSFEALYRYFQARLSLTFDSASSISTLQVRAFSPQDAWRLNHRLLDMGEDLVNRLNERARRDMLRFAEADVAAAEERVQAASVALSSYRGRQQVFDPEKQSALQLQQVAKLQEELIATRALLTQMQSLAGDNPQLPSLRRKTELLQKQIDTETAAVTRGKGSLAGKAVEYERLALERTFAEKQLAMALSALEQARTDVQRKQLYLERIVQPNTPDQAMEPRRLKAVASAFVLGLVLWGVLTMLLAGVREHQD